MAAITSTVIVGLASSSLPSSTRFGLVKPLIKARSQPTRSRSSAVKVSCSFQRDWLRTDYNVIGFGLIGWLAPSSVPVINRNSLTGLFFNSIGEELAHFPTPPALDSQFWLWLVTWHLGLFIVLTFGQIGFKGRTEDYF